MVNNMYSEDEDSREEFVDYKQKYRELKKNLRYLIYENECFQDELRKAERNYVSVCRDKTFLLDRILKYEKPQVVSSDSEATESSEEEEEKGGSANIPAQRKKITKRKRSEAEFHNGSIGESHSLGHHSGTKQIPAKPAVPKPPLKMAIPVKKPKKPPVPRKPPMKKERENITIRETPTMTGAFRIGGIHIANDRVSTNEAVHSIPDYENIEYEFIANEGQDMTREEVERHLERVESRRFSPELNTTATVPAELFSHEPDHESDFEESEICEFIQLEEDGTSADMTLE